MLKIIIIAALYNDPRVLAANNHPVITSGFTAAVPDESRAVVAVPPDVMSEVPASKQAEGCRRSL